MIKEQVESTGYKCPYCKEMHLCDDWGYDYSGKVFECDSCKKKFSATAYHSVSFYSTPDCELNNKEHDLKYFLQTAYGKSYFCNVCNRCIILKD